MIKGIIFDLDGTLIDSMGIWEEADRQLLLKHGVDPLSDPELSDKMKKYSVMEAAMHFVKMGVKKSPEDIISEIEKTVSEKYESEIPLKPYVYDVLDELDRKGIRYCIATANYRSLTESVLKRFGLLERFEFIVSCAETGVKKDEKGFFERAAALLGTTPSETAVVDDSAHCIENAADSGFYTVFVYDELFSDDWEKNKGIADAAVKDLKEFVELIV